MSWYGSRYSYGGWAPYVTAAQKRAFGHAAAQKLAAKEKRSACPVEIEGRELAKTFWGVQWCENLERYRGYESRLPRGVTYVRNGYVADLVIEAGRIRAVVGGSEAYFIEIEIKTLAPKIWKAIGRDCTQEIESLFDLLQGRFKDGVMQRLTRPEDGLFPHPDEISMSCTCPDDAGVCKHIAATFYGVAAMLDKQPELLFRLRNVDHLELIGEATTAKNLQQALTGNAEGTLADADLGDIFGIELEADEQPSAKKPVRAKSNPAGTKRQLRAKPTAVAKVSASKAAKSTNPARAKSKSKARPKAAR